jgi:hypothetical protein
MGLAFDFGNSSRGNSMEFSRNLQDSGYLKDFGHRDSLVNHEEQLNSLGFRCDEFIHEHSKTHILFAGCSVTWGDYLKKEESWPMLLLNKIKNLKPVSGFFSVAYPGSSIAKQISLIFKYIYDFGNPEVIFFLMPNSGRFFTIENLYGEDQITSSILTPICNKNYPGSSRIVNHLSFEMYAMLEQYCIANGIRLISSSWQTTEDAKVIGNTSELFDGKFETFFSYKDMGEMNWIYEYMKIDKDAELLAKDGVHPGKARQAWFAHVMFNKYLN